MDYVVFLHCEYENIQIKCKKNLLFIPITLT